MLLDNWGYWTTPESHTKKSLNIQAMALLFGVVCAKDTLQLHQEKSLHHQAKSLHHQATLRKIGTFLFSYLTWILPYIINENVSRKNCQVKDNKLLEAFALPMHLEPFFKLTWTQHIICISIYIYMYIYIFVYSYRNNSYIFIHIYIYRCVYMLFHAWSKHVLK